MGGGWIVIPGWDKFQHYSDRDPVWIKVYTELNSRDDWCDLSDAERGLLVTIWIEYARSRGQLKASRIPSKVGQRSRKRQFETLNHAGFIQFSASKPLALARSREEEKRREEKGGSTSSKKTMEGRPEQKPVNMPPADQAAYVRGLIQNHVITEPFELDAYNLDDHLRAELRQLL